MDIEALIKKEAGNNTEHDKNYAKALKEAFELYKDKSIEELNEIREITRDIASFKLYYTDAALIVIYHLLKEKNKKII